ncbi:hypothetical protein, partial [Sphingorhabdus sp.]|uniref:hypothetical protein n=1 Tax=Sphingorhabdus sp. TaxID=1902408 RepID=UPI002FDDA7A9
VNDGTALGTTSLQWSDLHLASGGVINFNSDVTMTHSSNVLTITGGTTALDAGSTIGGNTVRTAGKESIWIPAMAMFPVANTQVQQITEGTATTQVIPCDPGGPEYCRFGVAMPKSWNEGTLTFRAFWSHPATATNFGVVWVIECAAFSNDDALNNTFGSATVTDTGGTTADLYISDESSAITPGNTAAEGDLLKFTFFRDASNGSDTLAVDAYVHGIMLYYTTNAANDA